jgi:cobalt-zinc-cadmium efflux system outer membrane protein
MGGVSTAGAGRPIQNLFARGAVGHLGDAELLERFTRGPDAEAAFETLVRRHGPEVLRVCRRALRDPNDADDAFQATFLVLARRAGAVGRPDLLAHWLHAVALRVSRKAEVAIARRRRYERRAVEAKNLGDTFSNDVAATVRDEVDLLPESLKAPVVLCYFEGITYEAAARHLRLTEATIRGRLARARGRLRARLSQHRVSFRAMAFPIAAPRLSVVVPDALVRVTTRAATGVAHRGARSVGVSAFVVELSKGVVTTMIVKKLATVALVIAALGLAACALSEPHALASDTCQAPAKPAAISKQHRVDRDAALENARAPQSPIEVTLDAAIERALREDLDLRSKFTELSRERATRLIAGLRQNPLHYTDDQLVPYGHYSTHSGGQTHYDVNVTYPRDVWRSRRSSIPRDMRPQSIFEARFQDAARLMIAELCEKFVDVQAAQERTRLAAGATDELGLLRDAVLDQVETGARPLADVDRLTTARDLALVRVASANDDLAQAKQALGAMLKLSSADASRLVAVGTLDVPSVPVPPVAALRSLALATRPDLASLRLELHRADTSRTIGFTDIYLLYQPYMFNGNVSLLVPLPIYHRGPNQDTRPEKDIDRTHAELAALERRITAEVTQAQIECDVPSRADRQIKRNVLPDCQRVHDDVRRRYDDGSSRVEELVQSTEDYWRIQRDHADIRIQCRRARHKLNAAVANAITP